MKENDKIEEIELYSSTDDLLIKQVTAVLKDNNIKYVKVNEGNGEYLSIYAGKSYETKKIFVSNQDYENAYKLVEDIIESYDMDEDDLPDELKDIDETYFEDLVKKGQILEYHKKDGTKVEFISKKDFKKELKKENSKILKNKNILNFAYISIIPYLLIIILRCINLQNIYIDKKILIIEGIILILGIVPTFILNIYYDIKINKMRKKFISGEEYKSLENRLNVIFMIIALLIACIATFQILDIAYSVLFKNTPILSKKTEEYSMYIKSESLFYNYYEYHNEDSKKIYIISKKSIYNNYPCYSIKIGNQDFVFERKEIIRDKILLGIPIGFENTFLKMDKDALYEMEQAGTPMLSLYGINLKDTNIKGNIIIMQEGNCEDNQISTELNKEIKFIKKTYEGSNIKIGKSNLIKTNNKNVGFFEFEQEDENGKMYQKICLYSIDGKLIKNVYVLSTTDEDEKAEQEYNTLKEIMQAISTTLII